MQKSIYGNTLVGNEYLVYPFTGPIKYTGNNTGTFSKYSIVDKHYVDSLVKPGKRLIYGGAEWAGQGTGGLGFELSNIAYSFGGEILSYAAGTPLVSVGAGDATFPRIDAIVIGEDGTIEVVEGTPAATPQRPDISESKILIQYARIEAGASSFGASEAVYIDNGQWDTSTYQVSGTMSGSVNFTAPNPYLSTSCINVNTDYKTGIKFTKTVGTIAFSDYSSITMRIKFPYAVPNNKNLNLQVAGTSSTLSGTVSGTTINLMSYGLDREIVDEWQHIVVPTSKLGTRVDSIKQLTIRMSGGEFASNTEWNLDYLFFQKGAAYDEYLAEPDSTGGAGATVVSSSGVIGPAEDGDYTDGVFTDFTSTTPIGTAIDRFNELFMSLVPASAPALSDWSGSRSGGVNGKLSFDDSNPIAGSTYYGANTAPSSPISVDGTWASSGKRLSIYAASNTNDITGTLNNTVVASLATPTPAYPANSFGDADKGSLRLIVNGTIASTASLAAVAAINNTVGGTKTGFILSSATASKFSSGASFETFKYRTGTYLVKNNDPFLRYGYNYIIAEHVHTTFTRTLTRYDFIIDHNTDATSFSNESIPSFTLTGSKYLSGIAYYTGGSLQYNLRIDNLYRNTYYSSSDAITFTDQSSSGNAGTNPILTTTLAYSLPVCSGNELKGITLSTDFNSGSPISFNIVSSGKRRLNDRIGLNTTAKRTLQGSATSIGASVSNVYLDNVSATSTDVFEGFDDETRRLREGAYNLISSISSGAWDNSQSLTTGDANHITGLQVYGSTLIYPVTNFSTPGSAATNLNFGVAGSDYSGATGERTYIRYFRQVSPTTGNFKINIAGSGGTFIPAGSALSGNNIHVEFKAPGSAAAETGWLDAYTDFATNQWADGNGGRKSSEGSGRAFNTDWGLTIGTKSTSATSGYIIVKITVAATFTGSFTGITFTFL